MFTELMASGSGGGGSSTIKMLYYGGGAQALYFLDTYDLPNTTPTSSESRSYYNKWEYSDDFFDIQSSASSHYASMTFKKDMAILKKDRTIMIKRAGDVDTNVYLSQLFTSNEPSYVIPL